jgi:hypothetical protein
MGKSNIQKVLSTELSDFEARRPVDCKIAFNIPMNPTIQMISLKGI